MGVELVEGRDLIVDAGAVFMKTIRGLRRVDVIYPQHPRSIRFSTMELQSGLRAISGTGPGSYATEAERLTGKVLEGLRYATIEEILEEGLHTYMQDLLLSYRAIGQDIGRSYFYYSAAS